MVYPCCSLFLIINIEHAEYMGVYKVYRKVEYLYAPHILIKSTYIAKKLTVLEKHI